MKDFWQKGDCLIKKKEYKCALAEEGRKALLTAFDQLREKIPTFPKIANESRLQKLSQACKECYCSC